MANSSSASALIGNLKNLQKESSISRSPEVQAPNPLETSARMKQFFEQQSTPVPAQTEEKRVVVRRGEDFVVEVREKRNTRKSFLVSSQLANRLADEANSLGISQNELLNQILKQRYS